MVEIILNYLKCYLFGHRWAYNFRWMPDKAICKRCGEKAAYDPIKHEWVMINNFNGLDTDKELIERWH